MYQIDTEEDNMFPEIGELKGDYNTEANCSIEKFSTKIKDLGEGDILEFGVAGALTTVAMAKENPDRKIFAFDHFKGLEKTSKATYPGSDWIEGAFRLGDPNNPHIPDTVEEVLEFTKPYSNINIFVQDVHEMKEPSHYGIGKISAVNIDVDIYEPTVSSLKFLDECEWDELYIRFDDWHGYDSGFDQHERLAAREWLFKNQYRCDIIEAGLSGGMLVWRS